MVSPIPSVIAPSTAPGMLPRPPNTELINALLVMAVPRVGKAVYFAPRRAPARPAREPAIKNTSRISFGTFTPIREVASRS